MVTMIDSNVMHAPINVSDVIVECGITFMMCGIALLFSKSFGVYYFSGARSIDHLTIEPPKSSEAYNIVI